MRIAFFSCQAYEAGYFGAHSAIAEEDVDLVVCLGDYIYERAFGFRGPDGREDTQGPNGDGDVQALQEYRAKYRLYKKDANLRRMHAAHPFVATWDDHEVSDDYTGDAHPDDRPLRVPFEQRRRNGYRAFFESLPIMRSSGDPNRIYRSLQIGRTVELLLIDTRQYSDPPPCTRTVVPCGGYDEPRRHLGAAQQRWLSARLAGSESSWRLVANPAPIMAIESAPGVPVDPRNWDGYRRERHELLEQAKHDGVDNVAFLTGAIHTFLAAEVGSDGRGGEPLATEFVAGSVTTTGLPEALSFSSGGLLSPELARLVSEQIRVTNPHIKFDDQRNHGYGVLEATREELRVSFKAVDRFDPHARRAKILADFRVPAGSPRIDLI